MPSMEDFTKEWNHYTLTVSSDRGPLSVKWHDVNTLAQWANIQAAVYLQETNSLQTFFEFFPRWNQFFWNSRSQQGAFDLPNDAVILDIGSGIAVSDLLLATYLPQSKFYLLDREGFEFQHGIYYDSNYPQYHSWQPVRDAISASSFDSGRFSFMSPEDRWPAEVDCVTSYISYCWHYPKEVYWAQVMSSLKVGGKLVLDVRTVPERDIVGEISEDMKSTPLVQWFDNKLPSRIDDMPAPVSGAPLGGRFVWTRNK
jgi:hypothetical protein